MPSFKLEKYCFVCTLQTGGLITGWVSAICTIISLISSIFGLDPVSNAVLKNNDEDVVYYGMYIAVIVMGVLNLIPDILIIIGIKKSNGIYLLPWLFIRGFEFITFSIVTLILVFIFTSIVGIIFIFLFGAFIMYHWLIIYSLHLHYGQQ